MKVAKDSVVQANEKANEWAGCTFIVSEARDWGVVAYLKIPTHGIAYVRLPYDAIEYIGEALLVSEEEE